MGEIFGVGLKTRELRAQTVEVPRPSAASHRNYNCDPSHVTKVPAPPRPEDVVGKLPEPWIRVPRIAHLRVC